MSDKPDEQRAEGGVLVGEDTGKTTQAGRTVYKTPEGEMVSEKSTTFKYKGKWINIPSIVMGEKLEDYELKELLDDGLIEPTSIHDELEEAEKAAEERSDSLEFTVEVVLLWTNRCQCLEKVVFLMRVVK